jgi:hypothetical protein
MEIGGIHRTYTVSFVNRYAEVLISEKAYKYLFRELVALHLEVKVNDNQVIRFLSTKEAFEQVDPTVKDPGTETLITKTCYDIVKVTTDKQNKEDEEREAKKGQQLAIRRQKDRERRERIRAEDEAKAAA